MLILSAIFKFSLSFSPVSIALVSFSSHLVNLILFLFSQVLVDYKSSVLVFILVQENIILFV